MRLHDYQLLQFILCKLNQSSYETRITTNFLNGNMYDIPVGTLGGYFQFASRKRTTFSTFKKTLGIFKSLWCTFGFESFFEISIGLIRYLWNVDNLIGRYLGVIWADIIMGTGFGMKIIKLFNPKTLFKKQCCHFHQ